MGTTTPSGGHAHGQSCFGREPLPEGGGANTDYENDLHHRMETANDQARKRLKTSAR